MSEYIVVENFKGEKIGTIAFDKNGELFLTGETEEMERALKRLVSNISQKPIPFKVVKVEETDKGKIHRYMKKMCAKEDKEYMKAIRDILPKYKLLNQRILGRLVEE